MVSHVSLRITRKLGSVLRFAGSLAIICLAGANASGVRACAGNLLKQSDGSAPKIKDRPMVWNPPNFDKPVRSISATPPCVLSDVLNNAAARAQEFAANVPNFTATERIQYREFADLNLVDGRDGNFEYLTLFAPNGLTFQETRTPLKGTQVFPASSEGVGLPELALIFLPRYRADFNMSCEGRVQWNGQPAWVVFFQQRPDKPNEMLKAGGANSPLRVSLKGRAWLTDSGEILHLEIGAIGPIPIPLVENWWLSANYGPVQFHSQKIRLWLPQTADIYIIVREGASSLAIPYRQMIYHTFANFMVFSVHTYQKISPPH